MDRNRKYWKDHWRSHKKLYSTDPQIQVARTKFGKAISENDWIQTCDYIADRIQIDSKDTILDLCCGNGLLAAYLIDHVDKICAVDYSKKLLDSFVTNSDRITKVLADAMDFNYGTDRFSHVIMQFAAQHFSEGDLVLIIKKVYKSLKAGGSFFIGDIPDIDRRWNFYFKPEYRFEYFSNLEIGQDPIGTWYEKKFFEYVSEYIGYENMEIYDQPPFMINSNHRFDVLLKR